MEGLDFALRYPFCEHAKKALEGATLNEGIVELGVERIKKALKGDKAAKLILHESEKKDEIASFAAARMLLGHMRNNYLTNSFAVNESKRARDFLDHEDGLAVDEVAGIFGIRTAERSGHITIDLPTYVKFSLRNPHYRLINRRLKEGRVEITYEEKKRLIEEAIKKRMESIPMVKDPPDIIKTAAAKLVSELPKSESRTIIVKAGDHPPCVMKLLEEMGKHQNLPHQARYYLATYLLACGMSEENIVKLFSDAPDFSEKVTAYQVSHIKKKAYSSPACATVMTYGLCCAVCRIGSPVNWHTLDEGRKKTIRERGG
ncbi:MAG: hypothetical protein V1827_00965 [Candidatus Micrarchaeota archaeon]